MRINSKRTWITILQLLITVGRTAVLLENFFDEIRRISLTTILQLFGCCILLLQAVLFHDFFSALKFGQSSAEEVSGLIILRISKMNFLIEAFKTNGKLASLKFKVQKKKKNQRSFPPKNCWPLIIVPMEDFSAHNESLGNYCIRKKGSPFLQRNELQIRPYLEIRQSYFFSFIYKNVMLLLFITFCYMQESFPLLENCS